MLYYKFRTDRYYHNSEFQFNKKMYRVHSIVLLSEYGQNYLNAGKREAILKEHFQYSDGRWCWTYEFKRHQWYADVITATTDMHPDKLIESVICPADIEYSAHEELHRLQQPIPQDAAVTKIRASDCKVCEIRNGWIVSIIVCICILFFKDWYVKAILFAAVGVIFSIYRKLYINAYTSYIHTDDAEMLKRKYEVLYGINDTNKENHDSH